MEQENNKNRNNDKIKGLETEWTAGKYEMEMWWKGKMMKARNGRKYKENSKNKEKSEY